jgi:predicted MPP superfamily phosphohydrolase
MNLLGIILLVGVVLLLLLLIYMFKEAHRNVVNNVALTFDEFPNSFGEIKLFFISDIHKREISAEMLQSIKGEVDLVVIGGDLLEKGVPFKRVEDNIKKLKALGPCYFVWGNNDYEVNYRELDSLLLSNGVKILDNTAVSFESSEGDKVSLLGVDDLSKKRDQLDLALSDAKDDSFKILVSHNPEITKKMKKEHRIHLVISGHTHGGQIRMGKWGLFKVGGVFELEVTKLFISNGYGTTQVPLRLGAPAETNLITISKKNM